VIALRGIRVLFGQRAVLDGIDLDIQNGESTVILGRSGVGKSVLLKSILGLVPLAGGSIVIDGEDLLSLSPRRRADLRSRIGMLLQNGGLFDSMTVYENIAFPLRYHRTASGKDLDRRVRDLAALVDLTEALDQEPFDLSGGMRRRAALARCLVQDPAYLFYDEPTTGLDPATSALVETLIHRVATERKLTSVVVTHDLDLVRYLGDRIALLEAGSIVACQGRVEALAPGSLIWESFITAREKIHRGQQI
jgi:phospholipid/cholesterol/gamma-HCH transport system ATP-binding protein